MPDEHPLAEAIAAHDAALTADAQRGALTAQTVWLACRDLLHRLAEAVYAEPDEEEAPDEPIDPEVLADTERLTGTQRAVLLTVLVELPELHRRLALAPDVEQVRALLDAWTGYGDALAGVFLPMVELGPEDLAALREQRAAAPDQGRPPLRLVP
jgi:hypothetical protein